MARLEPSGAGNGQVGPVTLAAELRTRRQELGLSQANLARRLGVAANTLARWERGELRPMHPRLVLRRLAHLERAATSPSPRAIGTRAAAAAIGPRAPRHNLPSDLSSFVGRQQQLVDLRQLLETARVLTLTGAGGVGKTRLAMRLASAASSEYPDGVWQVDLAPLAVSSLVPEAVATAVGVRQQSGRPVIDTLVERLRSKRLLVVLDNCEHLVQACAQLADGFLRACPSGARADHQP